MLSRAPDNGQADFPAPTLDPAVSDPDAVVPRSVSKRQLLPDPVIHLWLAGPAAKRP